MFGRELVLTPLGVKKPCTHYCTLLYFWRLINVPGRSGVSLIYGFYLNIFFKRGDTFVQFLFYFIYVLFTSTPTKYSLRFSRSVWNLNLKCVISVPLASLNEIAKITGFLNTRLPLVNKQIVPLECSCALNTYIYKKDLREAEKEGQSYSLIF